MRRTPLLLAFLLTCVGCASTRDLTVRQRIKAADGESEQVQYFTGKKMVTEDGNGRTIIDLDARTMTIIYAKQQTYQIMSFDQIRADEDAVRKRVDALSPEERQRTGIDTSPLTLKPTGRTESIAGYPATEYALEGGSTTGSVWVTTALKVPPYFQEFNGLGHTMRSGGTPPIGLREAMAKLEGFPLRAVVVSKMGILTFTGSTEAVEVTEKPVAPDLLQVPPRYNKRTPGTVDKPGGEAS